MFGDFRPVMFAQYFKPPFSSGFLCCVKFSSYTEIFRKKFSAYADFV